MADSVWRLAGMPALAAVSVFGFSGYAALLSVAPLWAVHGGADEAGSGLVNGVLLLATVLTQFAVPTLLDRLGYGPVVAAGLVLMGVPAPLYLLCDALPAVLGLSAVRGAGFGILTVTGSAAVAHLVPGVRRGAAVGAYGLAVAVPNVLLLPASVAIAERWGFAWVFALAALPVAGVPAAFSMARALTDAHTRHAASTVSVDGTTSTVSAAAPRVDPVPQVDREEDARLSRGPLLAVARPTLVLFAVTMGGGGLMTFLPQITASGTAAAVVLLLLGLTAAVCRWGAGSLADRWGAERFLAPALLVAVAGLAGCAWAAGRGGHLGVLVVAGAVTGVAYGAVQNLTLVVAFDQVGRRHIPAVSAIWNVGFDAGTAAGAVLVGMVAAARGFPAGLLFLAAACAAALVLCLPQAPRLRARDHRL